MRRALPVLLAATLVTGVVAAGQEYFAPGENLIADGMPPIPQTLVDEVARYAQARSARLGDWHPARREMLVLTRVGETPQVHLVRMPGGTRAQLTFFTDRVTSASFSPRGDLYVFTKDEDGAEQFQNYRYDLATGAVTRLTDGKSRNTPVVWSPDGERLAYASTRRTGSDFDLYVMDPRDPGSARLLRQVTGSWTPLAWSRDGSSIVARQNISANERVLWVLDASSGEARRVGADERAEPIAYHDADFAPDGKGLYVTTDRDSEFVRAAYVDLETGAHTYLTSHIDWDVEQIALAPDGHTLAFVTNEDGIGRLRLLDTVLHKERASPRLPGGSISTVQWHANSRELAFHLVSSRAPEDVYSLDLKTAAVARWTYSELGGIKLDGLREPELIQWTSFDGQRVSGFLYRPPARFKGKRPVIVNIHGGPEFQARPVFLGRLNYYLQELGIAFIYPNVRGSSGYGKTFLAADNGLRREGAYKDIGALFDWIATRRDLDADRVMVVGGSYGGHMTLIAATMYADRIRCAVDVVGQSNLATMLQDTSPYRQNLRRAEYGDERDPAVRAFLERTAPVNNAAKITKPLFVIQGKNDPRVPISESDKMVAAARKNGTPVWYLVATDEGHGFRKKRNEDFQFYANALFVKTFLLGAPAPVPSDGRSRE